MQRPEIAARAPLLHVIPEQLRENYDFQNRRGLIATRTTNTQQPLSFLPSQMLELSQPMLLEALAAALSISSDISHVLAPHLPDSLLAEALTMARTIESVFDLTNCSRLSPPT